MQIQTTNYSMKNNVNFESQLVKTKALKDAFQNAHSSLLYSEETFLQNKQFLNAVRAILKDKKNNVVRVTEKGTTASIEVDGKYLKDYDRYGYPTYGNGPMQAVIDYAEKELGVEKVSICDALSKEEAEIAERKLKELFKPDEKGFLCTVKQLYNQVFHLLHYHVKNELRNIEKDIF